MELKEFLKALGYSDAQIKSLTKEGITADEIKKLGEAHVESMKSDIESETETKIKEAKEAAKTAGFAEGAKKFKKAIATELNLKVAKIDELSAEDFAKEIPKVDKQDETEKDKIIKTKEERIAELESEVTKAKELTAKEKTDLENAHKSEKETILHGIAKDKAIAAIAKKLLKLEGAKLDKDEIQDLITLKLNSKVSKMVYNDEKKEIELYDAAGNRLKNENKMYTTVDDIVDAELPKFITNATPKPGGAGGSGGGGDQKYSPEVLAEIEKYQKAGIEVSLS